MKKMRTIHRDNNPINRDNNIHYNIHLPPWCSGIANKFKDVKVCGNTSQITTANDKRARFLQDLNTSRIRKLKYDKKKKVQRVFSKQNAVTTKKQYTSLLLFLIAILITSTFSYWLGIMRSSPIANKLEHSSHVPEECKARLMQLTGALSRTEHALKRNRRYNEILNAVSNHEFGLANEKTLVNLEADAVLTVGSSTKEWDGGRATLWGIIPLWKTSPSPYTIVSSRTPTRGDCWPFIGSQGEVVIELSRQVNLRNVSIQHVRPDSANSALKKFSIHAIFENETNMEILRGEYAKVGTVQQFYSVHVRKPVKRLIFKVLSNHGNEKYTCVYRIHLYGNFNV